jgi:probable phosphoglycerate mutase
MSMKLPIIYVARHGETAWTLSGQHTGLMDLPLTEQGEMNARNLGERLRGLTFTKVLASPFAACNPDTRIGRIRERVRGRS